jgi:hypothetical protein
MRDQVQDADALKIECISEFMEYLRFLQKGYQREYDHILNMICFINSYDQLDKQQLITQYLLNYAQPYTNIR